MLLFRLQPVFWVLVRVQIYESEIPAVKEGLRLLLLKLYKTREEQDRAKAACRVLFKA